VVVVGTLLIVCDVHVLDPHLAADDVAVCVHEACLALADALYLGAGEDEACRVIVHEEVVELGALVLDVYLRSLVGGEGL